MTERTPTPEQRAVIDSTEPKFVVTASAGAGKTYVLVERYLKHVIEEGLRPDEILTITFTRKAAAEMKTRIVEALRSRGLYDQAQIAETGPIQTIHSFCERLLRENALEAGLDPNFEILSDSQGARLITECVREALSSPLDEAPLGEPLISLLAGQRRQGRSPYAKLEHAVEEVLHELRGTAANPLELAQWHQSPEDLKVRWEQAILDSTPEAVLGTLDTITEGSLQDRLQAAYRSLDLRRPNWLRSKADPEADQEALEHTCGLVQLACIAWWKLQARMTELQAIDFTALEDRAVRLVCESQSTAQRVRRQYKVALVDEAQDVNPTQYRLLDALALEREMRVGDAQQSIYGFRQADVELFRRRTRGANTMRLSENKRSGEGILNFVDTIFARLWGEGYTAMKPRSVVMDFDTNDCSTFEGVEVWKQAARDSFATAGYIQELISEGVAKKDICILVRDAGAALDLHKALEAEHIESRITGGSERFYTRIEIRDLANALRAVADPYDDFALLACLHSPMVGLSLDSIAVLALDQPVVEKLESFEPPLPEDWPRLKSFLAWYEPLRSYADRLPAWEVLGQIFARSDYLAALARRGKSQQLLANARKLLMLAAEEPELGPLEFAEQIRDIQELRHKEGDAPASEQEADLVTIMTVHKAKGLEFDVVVVPQTWKRIGPRDREVVVDPRKSLVATRFGKGVSLMHKFLSDERRRREVEEELRVLYVALTRAKRRLCVCLYPNSSAETISKHLHTIFGAEYPAGVLIRDSYELVPQEQ